MTMDVFPFCKIITDNKEKYEFMFMKANKLWKERYFLQQELLPLKEYNFGNEKFYPNEPNNFLEPDVISEII